MANQRIKANLIPSCDIYPVIHLAQYDVSDGTGKQVEIELYYGTDKFTVPSGSSITFRGTKRDKTGYSYEITKFSDNVVTVDVKPQMTVLSGTHFAELRISKGNTISNTIKFVMKIDSSALADDTKVSETDLSVIEKALQAYDFVVSAKDKVEEAKASAESAIQTKAEVEQLKKETVEQTKNLTDSAKQEISTVKDATVLEVTQFKNDTISDITSIKDRAVEEVAVIKADAKAEADKAKESETNAKMSETNASNSAKEAKASADSVANVVADVSKLKEDIGNKATAIIKKALGKTIVINDSSNLPIKTLSGTGKIIITGKNILDLQKYGTTLLHPFEAKAGTLFTLITNGELSEGGNIKFIDENGENVWFAIDKGKTKFSNKIASNVKGFYNLLVAKDGLKYCFSVGENDEYEEYVEQVITAPVDSEQLKAIHTNYPTTVLTSENEISVEYVADTEAYIGKKIQEALISQKILGV